MPPLAPVVERPARLAAGIAAAVMVVGLGAVFIPGADLASALLFFPIYGASLGWGVTGFVLAARRPVARLLMSAVPIPLLPVIGWRAIATLRPEAAMGSFWLLHIAWFLIWAWLAAGVSVAAYGWWGYAQRVRMSA